MSANKISEGNGVNEAPLGLSDPKGAEHLPTVFQRPGDPVLAGAGAGVKVTQQVNMDFTGNLFDKANLKGGLTRTSIGNKNEQTSGQTPLGNELMEIDLEKSIVDIESNSDDDFDTPGKVKSPETSMALGDITYVSKDANDSNFVKEKRVLESGAAIKKRKKEKRENEKKEMEANETQEEKLRRKFVEQSYSSRNKSYAQAAKAAGGKMLEVRSHNQEYLLEQSDFDFIDTECGMKFLEEWDKGGERVKYDITGGLSQGGVWISCINEETLGLVKEFVGTLTSPAELGGRYKVFGEEEKPYLYIQAWIPERWWVKRDSLERLIKFSNRWLVDPLEDGQIPHFRLSSGIRKKKSNEHGFFEVTFETDENLFPVIAEKRGSFKISMTETKFFGSGMVAAAKRKLGEKYDRMVDLEV